MLSRHFIFDFYFREVWRQIAQQQTNAKKASNDNSVHVCGKWRKEHECELRTVKWHYHSIRHSWTSVKKINVYVASSFQLCRKNSACKLQGQNHLFYFLISSMDSMYCTLTAIFLEHLEFFNRHCWRRDSSPMTAVTTKCRHYFCSYFLWSSYNETKNCEKCSASKTSVCHFVVPLYHRNILFYLFSFFKSVYLTCLDCYFLFPFSFVFFLSSDKLGTAHVNKHAFLSLRFVRLFQLMVFPEHIPIHSYSAHTAHKYVLNNCLRW